MGIRAIGIGLAVLLLSAGPAGAQYFGSNKVQYESFDFQVLRTEHFDVHYYVAEQDAALAAAAMAERWYERLSRALDHTLSERTPIVLYASPPHFRQTTVLPGMLPDGVGGFTDHQKGRVVLPFAPALGETDHVLGHELVHAFQRDILQQAGRSMALPLWFLEGMAEYLSIGRLDAHTAMWIRDAVDENRLPAIRDLQDPRWFPYRFGQALWAFLADAYGEDIAARALASKANGGAIGRLVTVTGVRESQLTARWHEAMKALAVAAADPNPAASVLLVGERHGGGRLNVGPALSPDGAHMVFLSERDRYSVDVFLADARTGRIERKLVTAAANARFDSLQFVDSAGAWDNAGKQFAFAALRQGEPILTILSMPAGGVEREQVFPDLDQIFDPSFSPTGTQVAFSGLSGGITDLYVFDLETAALRRLTVDGFADLQPAWSPDGRTLAFTTDRFTSSLEALTFGDYRLAAFDLESGAIRELPSIVGAKNIDPQWLGDDLLFVADADNVSNVFRLDMAAGAVHRVDERAERRHRHHRAQPGAIRRSRREPSRLQRLPQRRLRDPHVADFLRRDLREGAVDSRRNVRWRHRSGAGGGHAVVSDRPLSRRPLVEQHRTAVSVGRCGRAGGVLPRRHVGHLQRSAGAAAAADGGTGRDERARFRRADGLRQSPVTLDLGDARRPAAGDLPQRADPVGRFEHDRARHRGAPADSPARHDDGGISLQPCAAHRAERRRPRHFVRQRSAHADLHALERQPDRRAREPRQCARQRHAVRDRRGDRP